MDSFMDDDMSQIYDKIFDHIDKQILKDTYAKRKILQFELKDRFKEEDEADRLFLLEYYSKLGDKEIIEKKTMEIYDYLIKIGNKEEKKVIKDNEDLKMDEINSKIWRLKMDIKKINSFHYQRLYIRYVYISINIRLFFDKEKS
jgi:hypothetical protein